MAEESEWCEWRDMAKSMLYIINILQSISGITIIVFGSCVHFHAMTINIFEKNLYLGLWAIGIGLVIGITSGVGIYANLKERKAALLVYVVLTILTFLAQVSLGIIISVRLNPPHEFSEHARQEFEKHIAANNTESLELLGQIHTEFRCCGINGPDDYKPYVPDSCCKTKHGNTCKEFYKTGCVEEYIQSIRYYLRIIGYVCLVFAATNVIGAWLALFLKHHPRHLTPYLCRPPPPPEQPPSPPPTQQPPPAPDPEQQPSMSFQYEF